MGETAFPLHPLGPLARSSYVRRWLGGRRSREGRTDVVVLKGSPADAVFFFFTPSASTGRVAQPRLIGQDFADPFPLMRTGRIWLALLARGRQPNGNAHPLLSSSLSSSATAALRWRLLYSPPRSFYQLVNHAQQRNEGLLPIKNRLVAQGGEVVRQAGRLRYPP